MRFKYAVKALQTEGTRVFISVNKGERSRWMSDHGTTRLKSYPTSPLRFFKAVWTSLVSLSKVSRIASRTGRGLLSTSTNLSEVQFCERHILLTCQLQIGKFKFRGVGKIRG